MNVEKVRNEAIDRLERLLAFAEKKHFTKKKKDEQVLKWGRLVATLSNSLSRFLEPYELDLRLTALEEQLKAGVLIPNDSEQRTKT